MVEGRFITLQGGESAGKLAPTYLAGRRGAAYSFTALSGGLSLLSTTKAD